MDKDFQQIATSGENMDFKTFNSYLLKRVYDHVENKMADRVKNCENGEKVKCFCGSLYLPRNREKHEKSQKHMKWKCFKYDD